MGVPDQRDPDLTRDRLTGWLADRVPGALGVTVTSVRRPYAGTGFSSEMLLFTAEWTRDGRRQERRYVARVSPSAYQIFPDARAGFDRQYRVMRALADHVPVPDTHWFEPDPGPLGAPFFVMDQVDGRVPSDMPPYHQDG